MISTIFFITPFFSFFLGLNIIILLYKFSITFYIAQDMKIILPISFKLMIQQLLLTLLSLFKFLVFIFTQITVSGEAGL